MRDAATQEVVANISSPTPSFSVEGLAPGRDYLLLVTAANEKGRSSPHTIQGFPLKVAQNKISKSWGIWDGEEGLGRVGLESKTYWGGRNKLGGRQTAEDKGNRWIERDS